MFKDNAYEDFEMIFRGEEFIIATDFDDTLVEAGEFPRFYGKTQWFDNLKRIKADYPNVKVILWTCREDEELDKAVDFCRDNGLVFDAINEDVATTLKWKPRGRKPFAHIYVDDRNRMPSDFDDFYFERENYQRED